MQLAILDDYQEISLDYADWSHISQQVQIKVFSDHISEENEIVKRLQDFSIICVMRE
ncbi:MAG: hydroxyacid dehydrogenase, partial [Rhodospirillales bacterium]|nr:hydroxyacid dehydrogenase [Rhodospirillales bacterium]